MEILKKLLDARKKHFEKGGKLEKFHPIYEANRTLFFIPGTTTKTGPHVRDGLDVKRFMTFVILALMPLFLFGVYNAGYYSNLASGASVDFIPVVLRGLVIVMPLLIVSYSVGLFWEGLFAVVRGHNISEGFLVTGLIFPLTLPPTTPLWQAAVGISFGVVIGKEIFGGSGRNLFNPALTARAFMFFAYPVSMSGDKVWVAAKTTIHTAVDAVSGATPLAVSMSTTGSDAITGSLAKAGFTLNDLFFGFYPGSIGETSAFLCLIGGLFLCLTGIANYRIILSGVLGVLVTGTILNTIAGPASSPWLSLNPFYHLIMGGFAFGITFMATDPVSGPGMNSSKWIYGFCIGALTVIVRVFNPAYAEGTMLAILFMNLFAPLLDYIEIKVKLRKRIPNV